MNHHTHRRSAAMLLALASTVIVCASASATTAVPVGDTYISSAAPANNFGTSVNLNVGNGGTALVLFDLSSLPPGLAATNIVKATLRFFVSKIGVSGGVDISQVTSAWSESGVTFSTRPTFLSPFAINVPVTVAGQWVQVDVTQVVQSWVIGASSNNGIQISAAAGAPSTSVFLDSKESATTSHEAELDIILKL